ncbi:MAG: transporter substrate-binding domain-containing protein [Fretibacterium sp.]|nr:transporter substrate-binding domain-containing protein [Fretibacterium sp.]
MKRSLFMTVTGILSLAAVSAFLMMREEKPESLSDLGGILKVGIECDFAPYNWEESQASGTNQPLSNKKGFYAEGYDVQIVRKIAERLNLKTEFFKIPWEDMLTALNDGRIDTVVSGMVDTRERRQIADFSHVYAPSPIKYTIVVRRDSRYAAGTTLADFFNARLIGQKGAMMDTLIDQIYGAAHLPPVDTVPDMFREVNGGNADALVINMESVGPYLKKYPDMMAVNFAHGEGFKLGFSGICAAFRKKDKGLLKAFNRVLFSIPTEERLTIMEQMSAKTEKSS